MSDRRADVVVVGAGPAGAAAATHLARRGLQVVAVDRARFPRDKCCGDGLTTAALRRLDALGVTPDKVPSWRPVRDIRLRSPSGRVVGLRLPEGGSYAAVARRVDLDQALVSAARRAGAEVLEGRRVIGVAPGAEGVSVLLEDGGQLSAPYVIGADGTWSPLRKLLAPHDRYLGDWHAMRQYYTGVTGPAADHLWVWFEPDLLPGYAWSFPLPGGRANVGFGLVRRPGEATGRLGRLWEEVVARPQVASALGAAARTEGPVRAWPIPTRLRVGHLAAASGRVLFVGDAARAADPLTGEGVGQALETGELAAAAVAEAGPRHPGRAWRGYRRSVAAGLGWDNRLSAALSNVLAAPRRARGAVRLAGSTGWARDYFARWMFEDHPRALALTPWRWRAGAPGGATAYAD